MRPGRRARAAGAGTGCGRRARIDGRCQTNYVGDRRCITVRGLHPDEERAHVQTKSRPVVPRTSRRDPRHGGGHRRGGAQQRPARAGAGQRAGADPADGLERLELLRLQRHRDAHPADRRHPRSPAAWRRPATSTSTSTTAGRRTAARRQRRPRRRPGQVPRRHQGARRLRARQGPQAGHLRGRPGPRPAPATRAASATRRSDANLWASWGVDYLKYDNCGDHGGRQRAAALHRDAGRAGGHRPRRSSTACASGARTASWTWGAATSATRGAPPATSAATGTPACWHLRPERRRWTPYAGPGALERPGHAGGRQRP